MIAPDQYGEGSAAAFVDQGLDHFCWRNLQFLLQLINGADARSVELLGGRLIAEIYPDSALSGTNLGLFQIRGIVTG
ncbi:hypothetical protein D3C73_1307090 [compost metagenome]